MSDDKRTSLAPTERRFVPNATSRSKLILLLGCLGAMMLGAGFYGQWLMAEAPSVAAWLLGGGAILTAIAAFLPDPDSRPLRVGPAGLAIELGGDQPERIAWCEIEKIVAEGSTIVAHGPGSMRFVAGLPHHAAAAAWIVAEALDRIPSRVHVSADVRDKLPSTKDLAGITVTFEPVQVAGKRCKASGKLISFEDDARLCARCAEVYHRDHVGERCLSCEGPMAAAA